MTLVLQASFKATEIFARSALFFSWLIIIAFITAHLGLIAVVFIFHLLYQSPCALLLFIYNLHYVIVAQLPRCNAGVLLVDVLLWLDQEVEQVARFKSQLFVFVVFLLLLDILLGKQRLFGACILVDLAIVVEPRRLALVLFWEHRSMSSCLDLLRVHALLYFYVRSGERNGSQIWLNFESLLFLISTLINHASNSCKFRWALIFFRQSIG